MTVAEGKITQQLNLVDEAWDPKSHALCSLFAVVSLDGLSFCVLDPAGRKYLVLESHAFQGVYTYPQLCISLGKVIKQHTILGKHFKRTAVALSSGKSTLIPESLFESSGKDDILRFNHSLEGDEQAAVDKLKGLGARNLFALPRCFESAVAELLPGASISHHSTALIENILTKYKNQPVSRMIVHVQPSRFEVLVPEGNSLRFYNSFSYQTTEDFIYYVMFVCEQLKLNPETVETVIAGEIEKSSALYGILYKYIRNVKFIERPEGFEYSYKFGTVPSHFYYSLFCQAQVF